MYFCSETSKQRLQIFQFFFPPAGPLCQQHPDADAALDGRRQFVDDG